MTLKNLSKVVFFFFLFWSCSSKNSNWQQLFNGKNLTGWDTYLGPEYDTTLNKPGTIPIGLNIDPSNVFDTPKFTAI